MAEIRWLSNASEAELERINFVLLDAFGKDDTFGRFLVDGDMSLMPLNNEATLRAASVGGKIQVASVGPRVEDIIGVGVWFGPGQEINSTEEQRAAGGTKFLDEAPENVRKWWFEELLPKLETLERETVGPGFKKDHWYLLLFALLSEYQGKGIGKAMIKSVEVEAKHNGVVMILETDTETNVAIYKHLGFEVKGDVTINSRFGSRKFHQLVKTT